MLHGDVKVNDIEIARWTAENTGKTYGDDVVYACTLAGRDANGYPYKTSFGVIHDPGAGPLVLLSGILHKATSILGIKG